MSTTFSSRELVELDPRELVVGANARIDPRLDEEFLASIKARGVLVPIIAYRDPEARAVVVAGQRRTLAAVRVELPTVPVVLMPTPKRPIASSTRSAENDRRADLTTAERVEAYTQLAAFGLTAAAIAKRSGDRRRHVEAILAVGGSQAARTALTAAPALTLDQAATFAEFENDPEGDSRPQHGSRAGPGQRQRRGPRGRRRGGVGRRRCPQRAVRARRRTTAPAPRRQGGGRRAARRSRSRRTRRRRPQ